MNKFKEANSQLLVEQEEAMIREGEREERRMEKDRDFLRSLFNNK